MGITRRMQAPVKNSQNVLVEKTFSNGKAYRQDRLVEKWSKVAEIGKGITDMPTNKARNLAVLLENQIKVMGKMNEAVLASAFNGYTPENMLRLIRLSYPNSIRGEIFTEFSCESANDSIKYVKPVYAASEPDGKAGRNISGNPDERYDMAGKFNAGALGDVMYESSESQFVTEQFTTATVSSTSGSDTLFTTVDLSTTEPFKSLGYVDGYSKFIADGAVVAIQSAQAHVASWFCAPGYTVAVAGNTYVLTVATSSAPTTVTFTASYNSDKDLAGKYLGEVELVMTDYHFMPRPVELGVTWTQLAELTLDTSFGVSAEELLMDSAAQEIKKALDFQSIRYADAMEKTNGMATVTFNAEAGAGTKDSYWHTAQLIQQAIDRVGDQMLNSILRGGVTNIIAGPKAATYLKLNQQWSDTGKQPAIGGHKIGEISGISVYKVPSSVLGDSEMLTTWKNPAAEGDVAVAIGTLIPFWSTGKIQRRSFYSEMGIARYEDMKALQPGYLGRISISNIR